MPVLCMDISSDGDLKVTGSADKNIKIWGLDFGVTATNPFLLMPAGSYTLFKSN